jgi:hypothetical protein
MILLYKINTFCESGTQLRIMGKSKDIMLNNERSTATERLIASRRRERLAKGEILYPPHQFPGGCFQRFGNRLNCEKARIFQSALYAAQKRTVNVGFGSERLLRQFPLYAAFPDSLTKSFGNVVAHFRQSCLFTTVNGCRLYTTEHLDNCLAQRQNRPRLRLGVGITRQIF